VSNKHTKRSDIDVNMKDSSSKDDQPYVILKPAILKSSCGSKKVTDFVMNDEIKGVKPFSFD
jgi:hypothetical protein